MSLHVVVMLSPHVLDILLSPLHVYVHVVPTSRVSLEHDNVALVGLGFTRSSHRSVRVGMG